MVILFSVLFFIFFILLVVGLIKPSLVPQFTKREKTRKRAAIIYGLATIIFLLLVGFTFSPSQTTKSEANPVPSLPKCFKALHSSAVRQTTDQPDENSDYQVHVVYAIPSDGVDRHLDTNGTIATSVSAWQNWLCNQSQLKDEYFRLDTDRGMVDVSFVRLNAKDKDIEAVSDIDSSIKKLGFNDPHKLYAVYYDGTANGNACGQASSDGSLHTAALYLHGIFSNGKKCDTAGFTTNASTPGFYDYEMVHEIIHALGYPPKCAPHISKDAVDATLSAYHVTDSNTDIMYHEIDPSQTITKEGLVLDYNNDDYYASGLGYLDCPDLGVSAFWVGGVSQLPPKW